MRMGALFVLITPVDGRSARQALAIAAESSATSRRNREIVELDHRVRFRPEPDLPRLEGIVVSVEYFLTVEPDDNGQTILSTETRVTCGDSRSRQKFRAYWFFVRPFSGLIRRLMLKNVRKAAVD